MRIALLILVIVMPLISHAFFYTQENIHYAYHEAPASFIVSADGTALGATVSGMAFRQLNISNDLDVRLQRFEIGTAHWYVSDRGIIWTATDLEALSVYLSRIA